MFDVIANAGKFFANAVSNVVSNPASLIGGPINAGIDLVGDAIGLDPKLKNIAKIALGAMTGNVMMAAQGAVGLAEELAKNPAATTEYKHSSDSAAASNGYAQNPSETQEQRELRETREYRDALYTVLENFDKCDGAMFGLSDGIVSTLDLERVSKDPRFPEDLRRAAAVLLKNMDDIDRAAGIGFQDNRIGRADLEARLGTVNAKIEVLELRLKNSSPLPKKPIDESSPLRELLPERFKPVQFDPPRAGAPIESPVKGIIEDPSLSLEEKIELILMQIMSGLDQQVLDTMNALEAATRKLGEEKDKAAQGSADANKKLAEAQLSVDRLTMQLQKLMERRKQMFELLSNMTAKFHDMARTALSNLGRA